VMGSICLLSDGSLPSVSCVTHYSFVRSFEPLTCKRAAQPERLPSPRCVLALASAFARARAFARACACARPREERHRCSSTKRLPPPRSLRQPQSCRTRSPVRVYYRHPSSRAGVRQPHAVQHVEHKCDLMRANNPQARIVEYRVLARCRGLSPRPSARSGDFESCILVL
jgi:hypothetical protein